MNCRFEKIFLDDEDVDDAVTTWGGVTGSGSGGFAGVRGGGVGIGGAGGISDSCSFSPSDADLYHFSPKSFVVPEDDLEGVVDARELCGVGGWRTRTSLGIVCSDWATTIGFKDSLIRRSLDFDSLNNRIFSSSESLLDLRICSI